MLDLFFIFVFYFLRSFIANNEFIKLNIFIYIFIILSPQGTYLIKKKMKIHLMSDLHIDLTDNIRSISDVIDPNIDTSNTILILAGDIGNPIDKSYWDFMISCSDRYKHVIFITGNHEYYNDCASIDETNDTIIKKINELSKNNLHFLQKNKIDIDGITFIGTTLWTQINKKYSFEILSQMNDFRSIVKATAQNNGYEKINIQDICNTHIDQLEWLKNTIKSEINNHVIVITHHLPTHKLSHRKYSKYYQLSSAFYTDLSNADIFNSKIKYWFCGHTHTEMEYIDETTGTVFYVNPMGYEGENNSFKVKEFDFNF